MRASRTQTRWLGQTVAASKTNWWKTTVSTIKKLSANNNFPKYNSLNSCWLQAAVTCLNQKVRVEHENVYSSANICNMYAACENCNWGQPMQVLQWTLKQKRSKSIGLIFNQLWFDKYYVRRKSYKNHRSTVLIFIASFNVKYRDRKYRHVKYRHGKTQWRHGVSPCLSIQQLMQCKSVESWDCWSFTSSWTPNPNLCYFNLKCTCYWNNKNQQLRYSLEHSIYISRSSATIYTAHTRSFVVKLADEYKRLIKRQLN
jgi:hypothetical protein